MEIGDKDPSFIGSREWIGAIELSFVLDKLLGVSVPFSFILSFVMNIENFLVHNACSVLNMLEYEGNAKLW